MSIQSAVGYSEDIDEPFDAGVEVAENILENLDLQTVSIGILFANIDIDFEELFKGIHSQLDIPIIGCTAVSIVNNDGHFEESVSLMVITGDDLKMGIGLGQQLVENPDKAIQEAYKEAQTMIGDAEPKLAMIFPDSLSISGDTILQHCKERMGEQFPIIGGGAADSMHFKQTFQFFNGAAHSNTIPLLLLSGNIDPKVISVAGWLPVGESATITKAEGITLYEINNRPAIEFLQRYIPDMDDPVVLSTFPLVITDYDANPTNAKSYIIRSPSFLNKDNGSINAIGSFPQKGTIQLAKAIRENVLSSIEEGISKLNQKAIDQPFNSLLYIACATKKIALGLETKKEIALITNALPASCSINGFYSYGEYGPIDNDNLNKNIFHNCSSIFCIF